jgi:two-component sensor histidine kinase
LPRGGPGTKTPASFFMGGCTLLTNSCSLQGPPGKDTTADDLYLRRVFLMIAAGWTIAMGISLSSALYRVRSGALDLAREGAATAYAKDALYRRWNTEHGGVYVPVTDTTPPNPYLVNVLERDIKTPSGRLLTLLNHAYMVRQVYEMDQTGPEGHLVALHPLNPKNLPDAWETEALESFAAGTNESFGVMDTPDRREFRLIRPLKLLPGCVPCHEAQGFKEGDIYGGMSIAVDMAPYEADARTRLVAASIAHAGLWLLGLGGITLAWRPLGNRFRERQKAATALSAALAAKEVLLQEVHHRVKNNLQIISSLLNLEAESLPEAAQRALEESQRRIRSMALVHEQLYGGKHPGELDFAGYVRSLTNDLMNAYSNELERVRLRLELEPVFLGLGQAILCGLILNELVTNAFKYAFPGSRNGEVLVQLDYRQKNIVQMRVADNGVGLPPGFDWTQSHSLGLRIVALLTDQLSGTLRTDSGAGAAFTLTFPIR